MIKAVLKDDEVIGAIEISHKIKGCFVYKGKSVRIVAQSALTKTQKIKFGELYGNG